MSILSMSVSHGCVMSPLLYALYTSDCTPAHHNTMSSLRMTPQWCLWRDGSAYRDEVEQLTVWCSDFMVFNTLKTKEWIIDNRKN